MHVCFPAIILEEFHRLDWADTCYFSVDFILLLFHTIVYIHAIVNKFDFQ